MNESDWAALRKEYSREVLSEADVLPDPIEQLEAWMHEAVRAHVPEPTAMTLATATLAGVPSARIVLCKGIDPRGLTFFTNYESKKGRELAANPHAALLFHWVELERQVRLEGLVTKLPEAESDTYFASRPHQSRIGALASAQSQPIASREDLEAVFEETAHRYRDAEPPRPPHWGGYILAPSVVELWQGRKSRLHDRVQYTRTEDGRWLRARLCP